MDLKVAVWNIKGMSTSDKQKEVRSIIKEENLQMCGIVETHIKYQNINTTGKKVFGNWEFTSNGEDNSKVCRIMIGWNSNKMNVWVIAKSKQCIFLLVETICKKVKFFCSIVYASNSYMERRKLWRELGAQKSITNGIPWVLMGDFNVTLRVEEHSNGSSIPNSEMDEFAQCITWTKSRNNPNCKTLKKLDKIMISEAFMDKFHNSSGMFLPYMISDHSPTVLKIPNGMEKRRQAFRFSNFITDKKEFIPIVKEAWEVDIEGHMMYRIVKKMKLMNKSLNKLSWANGNIFVRVKKLRDCLKEIEIEVDKYPYDENIKSKSCKILSEYYEAMKDESNLLMQKAKIEWLKDGDRNTEFFHKIIKGRTHKGRIVSICNEKGERFENDKIAEHFVRHFQEFLGKKDIVDDFPTKRIVFPNKLSREEEIMMCRGISEVEVKNAMFEIEDSKAPGPEVLLLDFINQHGVLLARIFAKQSKNSL
ncbi:RNA-directed DNA polymerase, eukaryota, reverse transcriptase zinc-binding domain protein [Tanacetum coccineum]